MKRRTYYELLGISAKATAEEVKKAYRSKAKASHPDVNPRPGAAEEFVRIAEAFEILYDPEKRAVYDHRLNRDRRAPAAQTRPASQTNQANQQAAYEAWVRQARAHAQASAKMNYEEFKRKSKLEQAEYEVYHYLQYIVIGLMMCIAVFMLLLPIFAMVKIVWWMIFFAIPLAPFSFKLIDECRKGFKSLQS